MSASNFVKRDWMASIDADQQLERAIDHRAGKANRVMTCTCLPKDLRFVSGASYPNPEIRA
jgi:hypothetical protein